MSAHRFRVPTHLLVEGAVFNFNIGLFVLTCSWRQLAWLLGSATLTAYPVLILGWPLVWLPVLGIPLIGLALCGAFLQVNGLSFDRWLLVRATYAWSRPRRANWQPLDAPVTTAAAGRWVAYRPTHRSARG